MKRIYYASGSVLTGDDIAEAVLEYASALAKSPLAAIIHIPVVQEESGETGLASLLIGPASQVMCVPERADQFDEPSDTALVDELRRSALIIGSPRPVSEPTQVVRPHEEYE